MKKISLISLSLYSNLSIKKILTHLSLVTVIRSLKIVLRKLGVIFEKPAKYLNFNLFILYLLCLTFSSHIKTFYLQSPDSDYNDYVRKYKNEKIIMQHALPMLDDALKNQNISDLICEYSISKPISYDQLQQNNQKLLSISSQYNASEEDLKVLRELLESGVHINAKNHAGNTALILASMWGNKTIVEIAN